MQGFRMDMTISQEQNVLKYLDKKEEVLYKFDVVPLDYNVVDFTTPRFYITKTKLIFCFDEGMEVFELSPLDISMIGEAPDFEINGLLFTPSYIYSKGYIKDIQNMKNSEKLTRISITEPKQVPKYFLLRSGTTVSKSYKTWALLQLMNNIKVGIEKNETLVEILNGYFSSFNNKTMLYFVWVFLGYVLLKLIFGFFLPPLASTIIDYLFGAVLIFISYWLYISVQRNLNRYKQYYLSYSHIN